MLIVGTVLVTRVMFFVQNSITSFDSCVGKEKYFKGQIKRGYRRLYSPHPSMLQLKILSVFSIASYTTAMLQATPMRFIVSHHTCS